MKARFTYITMTLAMIGCGQAPDEATTTTSGAPGTLVRERALGSLERCAGAGFLLEYGVDENGNGTLDDAEVDGSQVICDGAQGYASLVLVADEPAGANCGGGGVLISTGIDDGAGDAASAGDGELQPAEVDMTEYVCNGACAAGTRPENDICLDIDECAEGADDCAADAECTNSLGGFSCACRDGYVGDGRTCVDVDECAENNHDCSEQSECVNNTGSYNCTCRAGYMGDGVACIDVDECAASVHDCDDNATCINEPGEYTCDCNEGFTGNGTECHELTTVLYSLLSDGNLGGRAGADRACGQAVPDSLSCTEAVAFISVSGGDEIRDMPSYLPDRRFLSLTGKTIAENWDDMLDRNINDSLHKADVIDADTNYWWSGSDPNGAFVVGKSCQSWSSAAGNHRGIVGSTRHKSAFWLFANANWCDDTAAVVCMCIE